MLLGWVGDIFDRRQVIFNGPIITRQTKIKPTNRMTYLSLFGENIT